MGLQNRKKEKSFMGKSFVKVYEKCLKRIHQDYIRKQLFLLLRLIEARESFLERRDVEEKLSKNSSWENLLNKK